MSRAGFEPATPAIKRPQTYPLDRAASGIGHTSQYKCDLSTTFDFPVILDVQFSSNIYKQVR
jgi:hypothetical protein